LKTGTDGKLIVENFAYVRRVVPDIGRLNLSIGPQATKKGACAFFLLLQERL
jgi:hypothetical protein